MPIYVITAIADSHDRAFGFFYSLSEAQKAVEENRCDMQECAYMWLVIEEICGGIHPSVYSEIWYEWVFGSWNMVEKPSRFEGVTNFGIG